jgi:hypothetical protein
MAVHLESDPPLHHDSVDSASRAQSAISLFQGRGSSLENPVNLSPTQEGPRFGLTACLADDDKAEGSTHCRCFLVPMAWSHPICATSLSM